MSLSESLNQSSFLRQSTANISGSMISIRKDFAPADELTTEREVAKNLLAEISTEKIGKITEPKASEPITKLEPMTCFKCDGSKLNKKGKTCKKCDGTGVIDV
jgi:hypothetical protein